MSNKYKDWYNNLTDEQKKNYELCMKYPILIPAGCQLGETIDGYMYEYTNLDMIPIGWRKAFGEQWAKEVQEAIDKLPEKDQGRIKIVDIKEKFGQLRTYFSRYTDELDEVIDKYTRLSERTCTKCGALATKISMGWISPYCDECVEGATGVRFVDIDEWFKRCDEDDSDDI